MIPRRILLIFCLFSTLGWASQSHIDVPALIRLLLAQGYHDIREIELEGEQFEVHALDAKDQKVHLSVDAQSGKIISQTEAPTPPTP